MLSERFKNNIFTKLQKLSGMFPLSWFSCNFNVLKNGILPIQIGLKEILNNFIDHRQTTIKRKSIFNKEKILKRLKILQGYLIVYKFLDSIIKIIRTKEDPKKVLI